MQEAQNIYNQKGKDNKKLTSYSYLISTKIYEWGWNKYGLLIG